MTHSAVNERPASCPRCGYDLRGVIASWTDRCPMDGRCAECGLEFDWAHVASSKVRRPTWCVEYALTPWALPLRCIRTMGLVFWPWGFWRSLHMHDDPRWWRIALYLVSLVGPILLVYAAGNGLAAWQYWRSLQASGMIVPSPAPIVLQAMVAPSSEASPGLMIVPAAVGGPMTMLYPPPSDVVEGAGLNPVANPVVAFGLVMLGLCAAGFVALPVSRRQARVLPRHLVRIALYSVTFMIVPIGVGAIKPYVSLWWLDAAALVVIPAVVIWWSVATRHHLQMRHAWGVGLAVVAMSFLATSLCFVVGWLLLTGWYAY